MDSRWSLYILLVIASASVFAGSPALERTGGINAISNIGVESMGANPAGIDGTNEHQISAYATRYWLGLEENLFGSRVAFVPAQWRWGALGIELQFWGLSVQNRFDIALAYSKALRINNQSELSLGLSGKWARNQYNTAEFHRFEDDPLFHDRDFADGFGLDLGTMLHMRDFKFGLSCMNLIRPSLSLSENADEEGRDPFRISVAGSYDIYGWITPALQVDAFQEGEVDISAGFSVKLLDGALILGTGYSPSGFSFGLGISGRAKLPIRFDYALLYPTGSMAKAGLSSHSAGVTVMIPKAERSVITPEETSPDSRYADLIAARDPRDIEMPLCNIGEKATFRAVIGNVGGKASAPTKATVFLLGADSTMVGQPFEIPALEPSGIFSIEWTWIPSQSGSFSFLVSADDDGSRFPLRNGIVSEINVGNNRISFPVYVSGPVIATVKTELDALRIPQLTFIADEEPLVPVVFFEKDGVVVAERFMSTLDVIANRLDMNPNIRLILRGYVDSVSDTVEWRSLGLHNARAEAVLQKISGLLQERQRVSIEEKDYDPTTPRIRTLAEGTSTEDIVRAQQENRRVEMIAVVEGFEDDLIAVDFNSISDVPAESSIELITRADEISGVLNNNPEASLIFEGVVANEAQWSTAYDILFQLREQFLSAVETEVDYELFPLIVKIQSAQNPELRVYLSGEGLVYRPKEAALAAKDFEIPRDQKENIISISVENGIIVEYSIGIVDYKAERVRLIDEGDGEPPLNLSWDWRDRNGNLVDPKSRYRVELSVKDPAGNIWNNYSPEISIAVADKEVRIESTIIVQFAFDELVATSKFLESRIESMARKIISLGQNLESSINVKIIGHTDPIGSDRRNMILSEERAQKEEASIRRYLRKILGLKNDAALERWLADHRVTLVRQGQSDTQSYEVERYRDGRFERVLLGNNTFPEGRSTNRRVIIQIEEIRESN